MEGGYQRLLPSPSLVVIGLLFKGVGDGNNHIKTRSSEPKQTLNSRRLFFAGRVD